MNRWWFVISIAITVVFAGVSGARAQEPAPLDGVKVPADHPRICMTASELDELKARLATEPFNTQFQTVKAEAQGALKLMDPAQPFQVYNGQSRRFRTTALLECCAMYALLGDDKEFVGTFSAFLEDFDDASFEKELPENDFMSRGELLEGLAVCLDWAYPVISDKARAHLTDLVAKHAMVNYRGFIEKKSWEATTEANNHSVAAMGGVGLAGLALWHEMGDAPRWARLARDKAVSYLSLSFDEGGAAYEGNMYGPFGLSRVLPFADALARLGHKDMLGGGFLPGVVDCLIAEIMPGAEAMLPINDTDGNYRGWPGVLYLYCATTYKHGPARWMWEEQYKKRAGTSGHTAPFAVLWETAEPALAEPKNLIHFTKGRGLLTVRTGWGRDDFLASFEAGQRRKGCHCQGDQGHFQIYAHGAYLAADTGYNNVDKEDSINQSLGHNLVLIDGKGQAVSGGGKIVEASMPVFEAKDTVTVAMADLAGAYGRDSYNTMMAAKRVFICFTGDEPYVVLIDNFIKDGKDHDFTFLLQGFKASKFELQDAKAIHRALDAALEIVPCCYDKTAVKFSTRTTASSNFGDHQTLEINTTAKRWLTAVVLTPLAKGEAAPVIESEVKSKKQTVKIARGDSEDEIQFAPDAKGEVREIKITRSRGGKAVERRTVSLK